MGNNNLPLKDSPSQRKSICWQQIPLKYTGQTPRSLLIALRIIIHYDQQLAWVVITKMSHGAPSSHCVNELRTRIPSSNHPGRCTEKAKFKRKSYYSTFLYFLRSSNPCTAITSGSQSTQLFFFKQSYGNKSSRLIKSLENPEKLSFYIPFLFYLSKVFAPLKCFSTVLVKNCIVILEELLSLSIL